MKARNARKKRKTHRYVSTWSMYACKAHRHVRHIAYEGTRCTELNTLIFHRFQKDFSCRKLSPQTQEWGFKSKRLKIHVRFFISWRFLSNFLSKSYVTVITYFTKRQIHLPSTYKTLLPFIREVLFKRITFTYSGLL